MTTEVKRLQFIDGLNVNTPTQSAETIYTKTLVTTTPYTPTQDETVLYVDTTIGNITINLPSAATPAIVNKFYIIKKITNDANKVILDPNGAETIDNLATKDIEFYNDCMQIHSNGTNWKIISQNIFSNQAFTADFLQSSPSLINNLSFYAGVGSNTMSLSLSGFDGSALSLANYATIVFHGADNALGVMNRRKITSDTSITIPSGATLGFLSGDETPVYLYAVDSGAGVVLGVCRMQLNENEMHTSVALTSASDAPNVLYTDSVQTAKPVRLLAKIISTQATAGLWATAPTKIQINNGGIDKEEIFESFYATSGGQVISTNINAMNIQKFVTKMKSTHGAYDPSTGIFTAFASGRCEISGNFITDNNVNGVSTKIFAVGVYKNANAAYTNGETVVYRYFGTDVTDAYNAGGNISCAVNVVAGDTLAIKAGSNNTAQLNAYSGNNMINSIQFKMRY